MLTNLERKLRKMGKVFLMAKSDWTMKHLMKPRRRKIEAFWSTLQPFLSCCCNTRWCKWRRGENGGGEERLECGVGKISGDEIEDDLNLSSSCGDNGELFQDDNSQSKKQAQKVKSKKFRWQYETWLLCCSLSYDCTQNKPRCGRYFDCATSSRSFLTAKMKLWVMMERNGKWLQNRV